MTSAKRLGMLTPSSNTVLEPVTTAMLAGLPEVSVHFARFRVTEIALSAGALAQFDDTELLRAAELLADAKVDVIGWNGTSSSWLGFEADMRLCRRITEATGIAATTSILALNEILGVLGVRSLGLVTPYLDDVQERIVANYAGAGIACPAERHLRLRDNWSFAEVTEAELMDLVRHVAGAGPDAIAVVCTNLRAAPVVAALETGIGLPVLDSIAAVVWKSLVLAGVDPARVQGWGRLFSLVAPRSATP
ncbi:maleate cis-trans isomerase family protein [Limobrevibacterium gyesilva]|uniref:Aspartate/glutamate racemase family protein n=1 Tax=Limobrevibacterium gyesilva TaxID=2991712 RepID=A0AA41YPT8_9PROT|nr:aspartate/glutamate racemase family protein [Limobrevibacterium gyesilva]MCW3473322.1 aspartate/glutamate racemase family protein [Limobrevibacterium gyesilva]